MQTEQTDPTFMDVLRRYRDAFRGLGRGVVWFWKARPKTKLLVSAGVLLCALAVTAAIGLQKASWREALAQRTRPLWTALAGSATRASEVMPVYRDPVLARSIAAGVSNRIVYVDGYHGVAPTSMLILEEAGVHAFVFNGSYVAEQRNLFRAGVVVMLYDQKKPELTEAEYAIIRNYIANGGRLMLLCPAWVWVAYEKKPLDRLPYNRIAAEFGVTMEAQAASAPLKIVHNAFAVAGVEAQLEGVFSSIRYRNAYPILAGSNGKTAAVAATKGDSRMILWGQNNLLGGKVMTTPQGAALIKRAFDWLLNSNADLAGYKTPAPVATNAPAGKSEPAAAVADASLADPEIARSIAAGVSNRVVYVDGYHAVEPPDLSVFAEAGTKVTVQAYQGFSYNRDELFKSGLLVMLYGMNRREPTPDEYAVVRQYIANGGRLLLACPAWVWDAYEHKPMADLPYDIIARQFGLVMDTSYTKAPLRAVHPSWNFGGFDKEIEGTFSSLGYDRNNAVPILTGSDGKTAAVAATNGNARIVLWSQDNLLSAKTTAKPKARKLIVQMVNWLLE